MSFLSGGAECGPSNPLNQLMKQAQNDRSLQNGDRFAQGASSSSAQQGNAFRQQANRPGTASQMDNNFFMGSAGQPQLSNAGNFDFNAMRREMEMMRASGAPPPSASNVGWANEMSRMVNLAPTQQQNMPMPQQQQQGGGAGAGEYDVHWQAATSGRLSHQNPHLYSNPLVAWREQFQQQGPTAAKSAPQQSAPSAYSSMMNMGGGGSSGMYSSGMMGGMGGMGMSMGSSFANQMSQRQQQQPQAPRTEAVSDKGKGKLVELDEADWEAQFKALDDAQAAAEASSSSQSQLPSEEDQDAAVRKALDGIETDITAEGKDADARFQELWNAMQNSSAGDSAEVQEDLAKWEAELNKHNQGVGYQHPGGGIAGGDGGRLDTAGWDGTEDHLLDGFGTIGPDGYPRLGNYRLASQNQYMDHADPLAEGLRLLSSGGSLTDAALAFEAATVKPQTGGSGGEQGEVDRERRARSEAWRRLGEAQAMNERETQAIRALEEAVRVDEGNLEAYMSLAISYINEGYDTAAHSTLQRYINRAYPHLKADLPGPLQGANDPLEPQATMNPWATLNGVTSLFLGAARENASRGMVDPEVQVGLGVLFYADSSYTKAEDCFRSALEVRPNDFLLWNRLGATLANGGKPEQAIEAYYKALELRPTFTRAIYNLSVSCLNLGAHHQAAEHLLSALALQQRQELPDVPEGTPAAQPVLAQAQESHSLWSTLRRIFLAMDRMDLAGKAHVGSDLNGFKGEFDF